MKEKYWIHRDNYFYSGDYTVGAREATPEEIESHLNLEPTPEETEKTLTDAVETHMNTKVQERKYSTIYTASGYAGSNHPVYGSEGRACLEWMCAVWDTCYNILNEVTAGLREIPTVEELLAELPELIWPE